MYADSEVPCVPEVGSPVWSESQKLGTPMVAPVAHEGAVSLNSRFRMSASKLSAFGMALTPVPPWGYGGAPARYPRRNLDGQGSGPRGSMPLVRPQRGRC